MIEVGVDRHRFAHTLVRETLHGELSATRRARQHRKVAEALETRHADDIDAVVTELATHWAEASAGGDPARIQLFLVPAFPLPATVPAKLVDDGVVADEGEPILDSHYRPV